MGNLTEKTAKRLFDNAGKSILIFENYADGCASMLKGLISKPETGIISTFKSILSTLMMLTYINLDLLAAFRQYLARELDTNYDKRQSMTKINVIMNEGYKKIYGFGKQQQEKSFWRVQIKNAVDFIGGLEDEYSSIQEDLKTINTNNVLNKNIRDLSVHYDKDPLKVYDMLTSISAEEITDRCISFMRKLERVTKFVCKLTHRIETILKNEG